jgi:hypothetical protein
MKLYELLKAKIGEREAEAFIEILENIVETRLNKKTAVWVANEDFDKFDIGIARFKEYIIKWMVATATGTVLLIVAFVKFT